MCHVALVQVRQRVEQLLNDALSFLLREPPLRRGFQVRVKRLSLRVLHDQVDVLGCVDRLVELDHVAVVELAEDADLADRLLLSLRFFELGTVVLLDRDPLTSRSMNALLHHCVCATANLLAKVIGVEIAAVRRCKIFSEQEVRRGATEATRAVVGCATELVVLHRMPFMLVMVISGPVIEKGEPTMLLMMLLQELLIAESLPVLLEFAGERIFLLRGMIHVLHSHKRAMSGRGSAHIPRSCLHSAGVLL